MTFYKKGILFYDPVCDSVFSGDPGNVFSLNCARGTSSLTSILDLLALGLQSGDAATLRVSGPQEQEAGTKIAELLEREYDFH